MTDEAKTVVSTQMIFEAATDGAQAPLIFFDSVPIEGHLNGSILLCLTALRQVPGEPGIIRAIPTVTAHLRTNIAGALALRAAIDGALKLAERQAELDKTAAPSEGPPN